MAPLVNPWAWRNASLAWLSTSTSALPMPTTSSSATPRLLSLLGGQREVLAEQQVEPAAGGQRERRRLGDDGVAEQLRAGARPRRAHRGNDPAQEVLGRRHVAQQDLDHR